MRSGDSSADHDPVPQPTEPSTSLSDEEADEDDVPIPSNLEAILTELDLVGEDDALRLHKAVYEQSYAKSYAYIHPGSRHAIDKMGFKLRDHRGNTPLHIAVHMRLLPVICLLLHEGADPSFKNGGGWSALQEAVATGDREVLKLLYHACQQKMQREYVKRSAKLMSVLEEIPDFTMEIKWEFRSWVPLVSRLCPHDTHTVYKRGSSIRMDSTLMGMKNMQWKRGKISYLFTGRRTERPGTIVIINHDSKKVEYALDSFKNHTEAMVNRDITAMLRSTLNRVQLDPSKVSFSPTKTWLGYKKQEKIGQWNGFVYDAQGFKYKMTQRLDSSKAAKSPRKKHDDGPVLSFDEYFGTDMDKSDGKGIGLLYASERTTTRSKTFWGRVWMSDESPLTIEKTLPVLQVLAPSGKFFDKLREFVNLTLPSDGFPVKIEIPVPVLPSISGTVSFLNYDEEGEVDEELFRIPEDFDTREIPLFRVASDSEGDNEDEDEAEDEAAHQFREALQGLNEGFDDDAGWEMYQ